MQFDNSHEFFVINGSAPRNFTYRSIASLVCSSPMFIPGQAVAAIFQLSDEESMEGQNGKELHCNGRNP
jgi:hypothetical protein